ncbi:hypothetical protein ACIBF6_37105 [Streptosporangium amethystogenes]|uniref:hypothetical protein n=1 Tax=Streptosporangium amethystogenes TaxID=2002 RepID=UPI0037A7AF7D
MKKITAALPPVPKEPICGCSHHIAFHDLATGQCHSQVRVVTKWGRLEDDHAPDTEGIPVEWENQQCPCRRYSGPEPLTTLYAPELSPIAVEEPNQREEKR